jgi:hypothetical protein
MSVLAPVPCIERAHKVQNLLLIREMPCSVLDTMQAILIVDFRSFYHYPYGCGAKNGLHSEMQLLLLLTSFQVIVNESS